MRVRFAPSPTGNLHIGGARTALFNWLLARNQGGQFLLRVEDTDRKRSEARFLASILGSLTWLGLDWDEEPIHQSARQDRHREVAETLVADEKAYRKDDAIWFRYPGADYAFDDRIQGRVAFRAGDDALKDWVIVKSDGSPSYNFAVVVDDADMRITHVIRGDDHLSNMPKQLMVYQALGLEPPVFGHVPMIHGPDGKKLSKRHGAVSLTELPEQGFLAEPVMNYLALLGWSPGDDTELMRKDELVARFSLDRCRKSPSQFDVEKLSWLNGEYLRLMPPAEQVAAVTPGLEAAGLWPEEGRDTAWLAEVVATVELGKRARRLTEFPPQARCFFGETVEYEDKPVRKVLGKAGAPELLEAARAALEALTEWTAEAIEAALRALAEAREVGFGKLAQPLRVAVCGTDRSPGIYETLTLIGRERTLARISRCQGECLGDET